MLAPELEQKILLIMASQKGISVQQEQVSLLSEEQYQDLMVSVFEYCDSFNLSSETSYLAKIYLDIIFKKSTLVDANQLSLLSLCCIWMAIKFNEPNQVSHQFTTFAICQQGDYRFSVDELLAMESHVLRLLQYKLQYTTPYHFIQPFFESFPWMKKAKPALKSIIELSGFISRLRNDSSCDIFYGIFFSLLQLKKCILQPHQKNILNSLIKDQLKIQAISSLILQRYYQLTQPEQNVGDENRNPQTQIQ